jgi:hypothetical protein
LQRGFIEDRLAEGGACGKFAHAGPCHHGEEVMVFIASTVPALIDPPCPAISSTCVPILPKSSSNPPAVVSR